MEIACASSEAALSPRQRTYQFLNSTRSTGGLSRAFNVFIVALILLNIAALVLESVPSIHAAASTWFLAFECFSVAVFILLILLVVAASVMYYAENEAQPKVFSSIPAAMWWAAVTLTTVGYGDTYPVTATGKVMGAITAMLGIGMFALPCAILGAGFIEELEQKKTRKCPHCGKEL